MSYYFSICASEYYQQKYVEFLLGNYEHLQLPYAFPVALSYIVSPILMTHESFLCFNDDDDVVGAFGCIYGTGEKEYEDTEIVQIQVIFLAEPYRGTLLFARALHFFTEYLEQLDREVKELRFWATAEPSFQKLFVKVAARTATAHTEHGMLDEYRCSPSDLLAYAGRMRQ
ncbi:hypothetical protein [Brevibacillus reuszeri]|uniref:hypothetical protein n=1 Tax=Brevibacillus reuszeri TaxID=54915 RepID=UPI002897DA31|nr:hypothetical protein [Brevibacillus reuszeri]